MYALIGGTKKSRFSRSNDISREPQKLLKYRYLMHPIRLTIMKSLFLNDVLISADIRAQLEVSWGEYRTHLKSLESKGYIEIRNEFDERANLIQIIEITQSGGQEYQKLLTLLTNFVKKHSPLDYVLNEKNLDLGDEDLYPQKF